MKLKNSIIDFKIKYFPKFKHSLYNSNYLDNCNYPKNYFSNSSKYNENTKNELKNNLIESKKFIIKSKNTYNINKFSHMKHYAKIFNKDYNKKILKDNLIKIDKNKKIKKESKDISKLYEEFIIKYNHYINNIEKINSKELDKHLNKLYFNRLENLKILDSIIFKIKFVGFNKIFFSYGNIKIKKIFNIILLNSNNYKGDLLENLIKKFDEIYSNCNSNFIFKINLENEKEKNLIKYLLNNNILFTKDKLNNKIKKIFKSNKNYFIKNKNQCIIMKILFNLKPIKRKKRQFMKTEKSVEQVSNKNFFKNDKISRQKTITKIMTNKKKSVNNEQITENTSKFNNIVELILKNKNIFKINLKASAFKKIDNNIDYIENNIDNQTLEELKEIISGSPKKWINKLYKIKKDIKYNHNFD